MRAQNIDLSKMCAYKQSWYAAAGMRKKCTHLTNPFFDEPSLQELFQSISIHTYMTYPKLRIGHINTDMATSNE